MLGKVAFIIALVPSDCSAELALALRTSRETVLTGKCPTCGAVPSFDTDHGERSVADVPVMDAVFQHRFTCPARRESVEALAAEYREQRSGRTEADRFERAQVATRASQRQIKAVAVPVDPDVAPDVAHRLLGRLLAPSGGRVQRCEHLVADRYQTWNALIAEGVWRCDQCAASFADTVKAAGLYMGATEEFTCDLCRRYSPRSLSPLVVLQDIFVMTGAVCKKCFDRYADDRAEDAQ